MNDRIMICSNGKYKGGWIRNTNYGTFGALAKVMEEQGHIKCARPPWPRSCQVAVPPRGWSDWHFPGTRLTHSLVRLGDSRQGKIITESDIIGDGEGPLGAPRSSSRSRSRGRGERDDDDADDEAAVEGEKKQRVREAKRDMRPGDWTCTKCECHNFANKEVCFRCVQCGHRHASQADRSMEGGASRVMVCRR